MKINLLLLTPLLIIAGVINAGESVDETRDAGAEGNIHINVVRGEVKIIGWDRQQVRVTGELDELTRRFIFEVEEDLTRIQVEIEKHHVSWGDASDLEIHVPLHSRVTFNGVSTDLEVRHVMNGLSIASVSGNLEVRDAQGRIKINTVSGDVDLDDCSGDVRIVSVSGRIEADITATRSSFDTVSGDITAMLGEFESVSSNTVSGDLDILGTLSATGDVILESVSGDINLSLADPINASLSVNTGPGGKIINRMSDHRPGTSFPARSKLNARIGEGSADIDLKTISGTIRFESN